MGREEARIYKQASTQDRSKCMDETDPPTPAPDTNESAVKKAVKKVGNARKRVEKRLGR